MSPSTLPDADWSQRRHAISFRRLMHLQTIRHDDSLNSPPKKSKAKSTPQQKPVPSVFLSTSSGYPPGSGTRTYGGHVFAQSAYAASRTVGRGLHVHNVTGWFLVLGDCRVPFRYEVRRIRDGGTYCLRGVEVFQETEEEGEVLMFVCTVAFKRDESGKGRRGFGHQEKEVGWLEREFGEVLRKRSVEEWPLCQGMDGMWKVGLSEEEWLRRGDAFPGLEMRKVDMRGYNPRAVEGGEADGGDAARSWRLLVFYRLVREEDSLVGEGERLEDDGVEEENLNACAHLYASDRNSLFAAQRALGFEDYRPQMGSLAHTVNFHGPVKDLAMAVDGQRKWFVQETWLSSSGADRVCHNSRLWDYSEGKVIASTVQDGMMRVPLEKDTDIVDGEEVLRKRETRGTSKL